MEVLIEKYNIVPKIEKFEQEMLANYLKSKQLDFYQFLTFFYDDIFCPHEFLPSNEENCKSIWDIVKKI